MTAITAHEDESPTQFAIRAIQHETWAKAHADFCDYGDKSCGAHQNPYQEYRP